MSGRKPLKEMRKLLHTGERMPVLMECAVDLKLCIRRREWEERASKALSSKGSLSTAQVPPFRFSFNPCSMCNLNELRSCWDLYLIERCNVTNHCLNRIELWVEGNEKAAGSC